MKVIICGPRGFKDMSVVEEAVNKSGFKITEVVSGKEKTGVDALGEKWAEEREIPVKPFPAKWGDLTVENCRTKFNKWGKEYNVLAGFNRNQEMAEYAEACIAIDTGSSGTEDMIKRAKENNLELYVHNARPKKTISF